MKKHGFLKIGFLFCCYMSGATLFAQGLLIEKKDGSTLKIPYELLERVTVYDGNDVQPGISKPTELSQCVAEDVAALQQLGKDNPQLGLQGGNPSDWQNIEITWEKNAAGLYAVRRIEIKPEAQLKDLSLHFDAKTESSVFSSLKEINIANSGIKELVVINQPVLETVSLNGLNAAPIGAINIQGGMALKNIRIGNLPLIKEVLLGGDSLLDVTLNNLPSLQEQSNLHFRTAYDGANVKDTKIKKLTLKGNLSKLNGLYLNDLGLQEFALETSLPEATGISLNKNRLKGKLNLKGLSKMSSLYLRNNQLEDISISECPSLKELDASTNKELSSLSLDLSSLTHLDASETCLTSLDITHLTALKNISISQSRLTSLTFNSNNSALERINLSNNELTSFVLPAEINKPYQIYLNNNHLKTLDLKHASNLEQLYIANNNLVSFTLPDKKEKLSTIECGGNHLTANFLRNIESNYTGLSDLLAAPQFIFSRVNETARQIDAREEINLGMEPYVVKKNGKKWEEIADITAKDGIFTLPADGTYRVICTEDIFSFIIYNMEFNFDVPYLIGEVK